VGACSNVPTRASICIAQAPSYSETDTQQCSRPCAVSIHRLPSRGPSMVSGPAGRTSGTGRGVSVSTLLLAGSCTSPYTWRAWNEASVTTCNHTAKSVN
jgi:hypothetical protein